MQRSRWTPWAVVMVVLVASVFAGCLEDNGEDKKGGLPPPREEYIFYMKESRMTGLFTWYANVSVSVDSPRERYPVDTVWFHDVFEEHGTTDSPSYRYFDFDMDGYISSGDYIHLNNLTDDHDGRHHNISSGDVWLYCFPISLDRESPHSYFVQAKRDNVTEMAGGYYRCELKIWEVRGADQLHVNNMDMGFLSQDGLVLPLPDTDYRDDDGDGLVSVGDVIEVQNLTMIYHKCRVQLQYDYNLVGFCSIYLPDIG